MENNNVPKPIQHPAAKSKPFELLLNTLVTGLLALLPLLAVVFLFVFVIQMITRLIHPVSVVIGAAIQGPEWLTDIFSLGLITIFLLLIGLLIEDRWCKLRITRFENAYLSRLPFYSSLRSIVQRFSGKGKPPFSQVVLVDVYNNGILSTAFVTEKINDELYTVFVPTAPNPTNGYIFHVPIEKMQFVATSPDDAMRSVISMGTGSNILFNQPVAKEVSIQPQQQMVG